MTISVNVISNVISRASGACIVSSALDMKWCCAMEGRTGRMCWSLLGIKLGRKINSWVSGKH